MPLSAREFTDITALLKLILNGYPGNAAILREYLQNSDDAMATIQRFILDERKFSDQSVVDPYLKDTQGPALIAMNDGLVREEDWLALRKINSSSKQADASQTGKNGLGFRASYHITDNPHILSGRTLMIFDPHHEFEIPNDGGLSIDLSEEGHEYRDQLLPFASYTPSGEAVNDFFNGTVFRLPLRTAAQAKRSKVKSTMTSVQDIQDVFDDFIAHGMEEAILFLRHIVTIEVIHIDSAGKETCLSKVTVDQPIPSPTPASFNRRTTVVSVNGNETSRNWKLHCNNHTTAHAKGVLESRLGYDIEDSLTREKLSPTIEMAYPLGGPRVRGRLFTLLPIPQRTEFPLHLNAVFALDPNRQHLKNIQEVGSGKSRERFLVEWNKIIFDTWTPDIWASFLKDLSSDVLNTSQWSLWPPEAQGEDCYWKDLITSLTQVVISRRLSVFPTVNNSSPVRIDDPNVVVAAANVDIPFDVLSRFGILVVQPPTHILNSIVSAAPDVRMLDPSSLHRLFFEKPQGYYDQYKTSDLRLVLDYLVFSPSGNLGFIRGLPWFQLSHDGRRVSLEMKYSGTRYLVPLTRSEATIFATHTALLAFDTMSEKLQKELSSTNILNVGVLTCPDVSSFLQQRLAHLASTGDEILEVPVDHQWIVDFWSWIILWKDCTKFFDEYLNGVSRLFLLPTSRGAVRRLSSRIIHFTESETFGEAWKVLGIYPISPDVPQSVVLKLRGSGYIPTVRTWPHIAFMIKNSIISPTNVPDELWKSTLTDIRMSLFESLPRSAGSALSLAERTKLSRFPIFMTREKHGNISQMNTIDGYCRYVDVDESLPLPRLKTYPNVIYVDMRDSVTRSLLKLVESSNITVETQFEILQLAIDNWEQQPEDHQDVFIGRIFLNPYQLPPKLRASLHDIPFVTVNDHLDRVAPKNLIHPHSPLSALYLGEPAKMPTGRFCEEQFLSIMISFGFLRNELDQHVVEDRIHYFASSSLQADPLLHHKAANFLKLLDRSWSPSFKARVASNRDKAWIPAPGLSDKLLTPSECRDKYSHDDHAHRYYYDLTLAILDSTLNNSLRDALGWCAPVPRHVLLAQFKSTLEDTAISPEGRSSRLVKLIIYLDKLLAECQFRDELLRDLQNLVSGRPWIPNNLVPSSLANTQYALLDNTQLRIPFCAIDNRLKGVHFLQLMGCQKRPPMSLLLAQLNMIIGVLPKKGHVYPFTSTLGQESAISILNEIATYHQSEISQNVIHLPCENERAHPSNDVYFRDVKSRLISSAIEGKFAVHNAISSALAESLGIPLLSSIALGDDADDDDDDEEQEEQMGEDFVTRIRGFLRDYDPKYAITEFIANADDAWAKKFSLLLSNGVAPSIRERVVSPQIQGILDRPFLALHNDAKMSAKDMSGILRVGAGGKGRNMDTHGRHGLGALSFYYFTDVATIISDERVLILDPSGSYLPPFKSRRKRTSTSKNLSTFISSYPDQLSPYNDLFGFSTAKSQYNGTLIILPLCATITEKASDLVQTRRYIESSYKEIAQKSLFFSTHLQNIAAFEAAYGKIGSCFWEYSASRDAGRMIGSIDIQDMQLSLGRNPAIPAGETPENWVIATSDTGEVPQQHLKTAATMKMAPYNVKVQIAVCVAKVEQDPKFEGYPFSTVPLPKSTSLPFHMNARFAISSNRQNLVINSADGQDQKDSHTSFNTWLLDSLIAPLYLKTLAFIIQRGLSQNLAVRLKSNRWWHLNGSDDVSNIFAHAIHRAVPHSPAPIMEDCTNRWITFSQSTFSTKDQRDVEDFLVSLEVPFFVASPRYQYFSRLDSAKPLNPSFVKNALLQNAGQILSENGGLIKNRIFATLEYLRDETSLVGLPLLLLAPHFSVRVVPGMSQDPVYVASPWIQSVFPSSPILSEGYSAEVIKRLVTDCTVNVHDLTEDNVITLIETELHAQSPGQKAKWITSFWTEWYDKFPGPPRMDVLKQRGISIVQTRTPAVLSLSQCTSDSIVYNKEISEPLLGVVQYMGIDIVDPIYESSLDTYLSPLFPSTFGNVILCIYKIGFHTLSSLPEKMAKLFSEWVIRKIPSVSSSWSHLGPSVTIPKRDWAGLPIWKAYKNGELVYRGAADIDILPAHLHVDHILPIMKKDTMVAPWSAELIAMIDYCLGRNSPAMSASQVMSKITLPTKLTSRGEIENMKNFLRSMLHYRDVKLISIGLMVPDQQGVLRRIDELYDSGNRLFSATLIFTPRSSFLHEEFRRMNLKDHGLIHKIDWTTFRHCCNAVEEAFSKYFLGGDIYWENVCFMSTAAFSAYQEEIPPLIWNAASLQSLWASLDSIKFVQRKDIRRQGVSYHIQTHYCAQDLPRLVAPSQLVLAKFEPIAWTQRGLFLSEPSEPLTRSNTALGVPSAAEVVAHLKVLTAVIAHDHPGDLTLLSDIKATYAWLNEHTHDAEIHLQAIQDEKIFLNVSDPTSELWSGKWVSAKEVVLYLQYDVEPLVYAREFLLLFEPLLLAAGCESLKETVRKPVDIPNSSTDAHFTQWKDGFNSLRLSGVYTDITLVPKSRVQDIVDVDVDLTQLRAHRVVLAVAIPHLLTMQTWKEANDDSVDIYGTSFGAKAVLDFVYTGEIELSAKTEDKEKLLRLLRDLLEVFPIANEWGMNSLKAKIQHEIIYKHDMIQRLPEHFNILLGHAKTYNADILIQELERFKSMHGDLLRRLEQSIEKTQL